MVPRAADQGRPPLSGFLRRAALALAALACASAHAGTLRACDPADTLDAAQKDKLFRFGAAIKAELDRSGRRVALVARSGLDLARFGIRYSHAGFSLQASPDAPWAVRQLYYACDEQQPRIFDQGMLAFVLGMNAADIGYVSALLLPEADGAQIERAALDNGLALQLLGATYSANAYPFSLQYQNCNQWVVEVLAAARGRLQGADAPDSPLRAPDQSPLRARAQGWLQAQGYAPSVIDVGWRPMMWATWFVPWLHNDDHPEQDLADKRYRVSMPASIEGFMQAQVPGATRLEFCHNTRHVVVRRGGAPIAEGCVPGEADTVIPLD
ncbi:MAG: DUF2145 domain-containing protein [Rubrivivax sp.]|nr:DUF2145 domain-containing protein [Rubrivivax sp.]